MIHPHTELRPISPEVGYGVVATAMIPAGTITWALDNFDQEFTPSEFDQMAPHYQAILDFYAFRNNKGNHILCWDYGRYMNHSFQPSCFSTAYDFEVALRDIQPGEQLTCDYGYLNISSPFKGIDEGTRRKTVYPDDLVKYHAVWDKKIQKMFPKIVKCGQPLRKLIADDVWAKVERISKGEEQMDSILSTLYRDQQKVAK